MPETNRTLTYAGESIPFHLSYSKRKSLEIAVHPDCSVVVKAPLGTDETLVEDFIYKRVRWIRRQLRYFAQFAPRTPKRQVCRWRKPSLSRQTVSAEDKPVCNRRGLVKARLLPHTSG